MDLDGAFKGTPQNLEIVEEMLKVLKIPLQLGGGIRDFSTIKKILSLGVKRVILGTSAISSEGLVKEACLKFGERIAVGIDAYEGKGLHRNKSAFHNAQMEFSIRRIVEKHGYQCPVFCSPDELMGD